VRIKRLPVDDELLLDGELVVLTGQTVQVLSEIATIALDHLSTAVWTSMETLTARLETSVGLPPDGIAAVSSLVSALKDAGLITVDQP
jgi:hypothetical protein